MSDLSKDAGYLGDLETSSSELHGLGSEDDTFVESKKGISLFISDHFTNTPQTAHSIDSKVFFAISLTSLNPKVTIAAQNCYMQKKNKEARSSCCLSFFHFSDDVLVK